jgi:hypothetical protein
MKEMTFRFSHLQIGLLEREDGGPRLVVTRIGDMAHGDLLPLIA